MVQAKLAFGVEIELLLKPNAVLVRDLNRTYAAKGLSEIAKESKDWASGFEIVKKAELDASGRDAQKAKEHADRYRNAFRKLIVNTLRAEFMFPIDLHSEDYQEWSLTDEPTLDEVPGYCRVEFVSRTFPSDDLWQDEFVRLYDFLSNYCGIIRTTSCSTHVHVSPSDKPRGKEDRWSAADLRGIMKAISYYDQPITKIMPAERKENPYAESNMVVSTRLQKLYQGVEQNSWLPLFKYYDDGIKSEVMRLQAHQVMGGTRLVSWNFEHIAGACGTIEFRRSPGVSTAKEAQHWVAFTLGFIYQAARGGVNWDDKERFAKDKAHPSVAMLETFVTRGVQGLEPTCQKALGKIVEDNSPPTVYSAAEIKEKKEKLERQGSPYAETAEADLLVAPQPVLLPLQGLLPVLLPLQGPRPVLLPLQTTHLVP